MKKISIILLSVLLLFSSISIVLAEDNIFPDISTSHWAYENVVQLTDLGIINGYGDGTFKPNNNVSIAEFTKLVLCAIGNDVGNSTTGKWYLNYINEAIKIGLIEEGEFTNYDNYITRAEMSKIVVNAIDSNYVYPENLTDYTNLIKDYNLIDETDKDYILKAYSLGILTGNGDGTFRPNSFALRTETSTIVARLIFPDKRILPDLEPKEEEIIEEETIIERINPFTYYEYRDLWDLCNYAQDPRGSGYRVENDTIVFNSGGTPSGEDYIASETLNPNINYQLYNVTESLIDQNHYVQTYYNGNNIVGIAYGKGEIGVTQYDATFFNYYFRVNTPYNAKEDSNYEEFSENVVISLSLHRLWWESEDAWSLPYYEKKLKDSLVIIFGETTGVKIYDYVFEQYIFDRTSDPIPDTDGNPYNNYLLYTKEIDNIHIDYTRDNTLYFDFSYIN